MMTKALPLLLAGAFFATALAAPAEAKSKRRAHAASAPAATTTSSLAPARMIEVRPGVWISSYGCIQDEGYGRYSSCDISDGMR